MIGLIVRYRDHAIQDLAVQDLRNKAGADSLNLVGTGLSAGQTGEPAGSTAMTLAWGLRSLITSPHPVIVPSVPMAATKASTLSIQRFQNLQVPVVIRCIAGLAGFEN